MPTPELVVITPMPAPAPSPGPSPRVEKPGAGPAVKKLLLPVVAVAPPPAIVAVPKFSNGRSRRNIDDKPNALPTNTSPTSSCMETVAATSIPNSSVSAWTLAKSIASWSVMATSPSCCRLPGSPTQRNAHHGEYQTGESRGSRRPSRERSSRHETRRRRLRHNARRHTGPRLELPYGAAGTALDLGDRRRPSGSLVGEASRSRLSASTEA